MPAESHSAGEELCIACGLCCKGVWFPYVKVKPEEIPVARLHRFPLEHRGKDVVFYQPCAKHTGEKCSAYASWRPSACVNFVCELLHSYSNGDVTREEALGHVAAAKALVEELSDDIRKAKGGLRGDTFVSYLHEDPDVPGVQRPPVAPATKIAAVALNMYYTKFFRRAKSGGSETPREDSL